MIKHKLLSLFVALVATTALWASNTITYTATEKLSTGHTPLIIGATTFGPAITSHTFSNGIGKITCSGEITKIGGSAFSACPGLTSVTIPSSVTMIGDDAFFYCDDLTSITIPNSVTTIGDNAFEGCSGLTGTLIIPNSVTTIGNNAFYNCSGLTSLTIGNSVTTIGYGAFYDCSGLKGALIIPNSVTIIGYGAFYCCSGLTSIEIPNSVTALGEGAFYGCSGLNSIKCYAVVPPSIDKNTFYGVRKAIPLYVPKGSITWYQGDTYWKEFLNIQGMDDTAIETIKKNFDSAKSKFIINNSLNILHNGKLYNATGARMK